MKIWVWHKGVFRKVPAGEWWEHLGRPRWKRVKHALEWPFEWLGIGLGLLVLTNLPRRVLFAVCDLAAAVMYFFDRTGRAQADTNLDCLFGCGRLSPKARRLIVRRSYRNMGRAVGYAFWTFRNARSRCADAGELSPRVHEFLSANRPAVTVSGHIGCWEILSQLAFLDGHAMMSVAKDIGTSGMTRLLMRARRSIGQEIVPATGAFKPLMAGIRSGRSLGLLVDQRVASSEGGVAVDFFGRSYEVSPAPAFFAAKAKAPLLVAWSRPLRDGRYRCEYIAEYGPAAARDIRGLTQHITSDLERIIRRHPSCWVLNYDYFQEN